MPAISRAKRIENAFEMGNVTTYPLNPRIIDMVKRSEFYPDFKSDNFSVEGVTSTEKLNAISDEVKRVFSPAYDNVDLTYIHDDNKVIHRGGTDEIFNAKFKNFYETYICNKIYHMSPSTFYCDHARGNTSSQSKYNFYANLQLHALCEVKRHVQSFEFEIIDNLSPDSIAEHRGKAAIKDDKGRVVYLKIGKAIKRMFPNLPTSAITHMTEAMKNYYDKNNVQLFVHEGDTAKHFRYSYMTLCGTETNPSLRGIFSSLQSSCMKGQVMAPDIGIDRPIREGSNLSDHFVRKGHHAAEAYASGDFSTVYVTDKEDPFDPTAKVHSRVNVAHLQIDKEKLDLGMFKDSEDYVSISKIYIVSEVAKAFMLKYLQDKYGFKGDNTQFFNHNTVLTMYNAYNQDGHRHAYTENGIPSEFLSNLKAAIKRPVRLLALKDNASQYTTKDTDEFYSCNYDGGIRILAPYSDYEDFENYQRPITVLADENVDIPTLDVDEKMYIYFIGTFLSEGNKCTDGYSVNDRFTGYTGYNYMPRMIKMVTCAVTKNKVKSDNCVSAMIYKDGVGKKGFVSNSNWTSGRKYQCTTMGNTHVCWFMMEGDHDDLANLLNVYSLEIDQNGEINLGTRHIGIFPRKMIETIAPNVILKDDLYYTCSLPSIELFTKFMETFEELKQISADHSSETQPQVALAS